MHALILSFASWQSAPVDCERAVRDAIDIGYRHIDTAALYGNEADVGRAVRAKIAEGVVRRDEMFIVTKLDNFSHLPAQVRPACQHSIDALGLGPIDLYLLHTPMGYEPETTDYVDTWLAMEPLLADGLVRALGVSNLNVEQLQRVLRMGTVRPVTNQVECSPNLLQPRLRTFCDKHNILLTAYGPLTRPHRIALGQRTALGEPMVLALGRKYGKTVYQICLRYMVSCWDAFLSVCSFVRYYFIDKMCPARVQIQIGTVPIPKSIRRERIAENFDVFDFRLCDAEVADMRTLDCALRMCPFPLHVGHRHYMFDGDAE